MKVEEVVSSKLKMQKTKEQLDSVWALHGEIRLIKA